MEKISETALILALNVYASEKKWSYTSAVG